MASRVGFLALVIAMTAMLLAPAAAKAGTLSTSVIGLFPKEVNEFAYADLKSARKQKWFPQLKEQALPSRFRQFEQFLASAGIDPNTQVDELAWGLEAPSSDSGERIVGVALGQFNPASAEAYFKQQKLPLTEVRGFTLFAYGSGEGPNDIFFFFIDSNMAAFGHRSLLEKLISVRYGAEESLLRNEQMFPLVNETNGRGVFWVVLDATYTQIALNQLVPEAAQFPDAGKMLAKIRAMTVQIEAERSVDARFLAVCATPEEANVFAQLLQAGIMFRSYQEKQSNPQLSAVLDDTKITPRGDRLEVRMGITEEILTTLLKRNTFATRM